MTGLILGLPSFMTPGRLWLIVVPLALLGLYIFLSKRKSRRGIRYTNTSILDIIVPAQSQWLRHVTVGLALVSLVCLAFAWARPLGTDQVPRERATVVLILDISNSMGATDLSPSRLAVAQQEVVNLVDSLPDGYNLALVEMAGSSTLVLPPTTDREIFQRAVQGVELEPSTDVAAALRVALSALELVPAGEDDQPVPAAVVMFSDASGTTGSTSPKQVAGQLAELGVPLYPIVFGTDYGYVDLTNADGQVERYQVPPDHQFFAELAQITGGQAYGADDAAQAQEACAKIQSTVGHVEVEKEVTAQWAGLAAVFAAVAAVGAVMLGARWR
ncbi:MAG: VWA domain-containing protein [Propionibacteriaceae bacterium]|nr:VWA domain-containing protein [Propionibacteriaceae bacterium]